MCCDRVENGEYVLQNNHLAEFPDLIRISREKRYYDHEEKIKIFTSFNKFVACNNVILYVPLTSINAGSNPMIIGEWYLCDKAYSIFLLPHDPECPFDLSRRHDSKKVYRGNEDGTIDLVLEDKEADYEDRKVYLPPPFSRYHCFSTLDL